MIIAPLNPQIYWTTAEALDTDAVARLVAELPPDEAQRAQRFRFDRDRATYMAAHVMLRRVLCRLLADTPPVLVRSPLGRPELAAIEAPISFNLMHSRDFAACGVMEREGLGIDAEDIAHCGSKIRS